MRKAMWMLAGAGLAWLCLRNRAPQPEPVKVDENPGLQQFTSVPVTRESGVVDDDLSRYDRPPEDL